MSMGMQLVAIMIAVLDIENRFAQLQVAQTLESKEYKVSNERDLTDLLRMGISGEPARFLCRCNLCP